MRTLSDVWIDAINLSLSVTVPFSHSYVSRFVNISIKLKITISDCSRILA